MAEPITTATAAAVSFGLSALLAGWIGQIEAEVMMVVLSAIAGSMVALSSKKKTFFESLKFIFLGVLVATLFAWAISYNIANQYPYFASPYLPTIVAFVLAAIVDKLPIFISAFLEKVFNRA